ncbi:MAG: glycoside hydrolase family 2 protein [Candidatus Sumerlaeaceae bacterium]
MANLRGIGFVVGMVMIAAHMSNGAGRASARERIPLDGEWKFRLDPDARGESQRWFADDSLLTQTAVVPGCWDVQGLGIPGAITTVANADDTGHNVRTPTAYTGKAWYARDFETTATDPHSSIWLTCGGVNDRCRVWLNGKHVGAHDGYNTAFDVELTGAVRAGKNHIVIEVDNAPRPEGNLEGCMDFFTNWGGIHGNVCVENRHTSFLDNVHARCNATSGIVEFAAYIRGSSRSRHFRGTLHVAIADAEGNQVAEAEIAADATTPVQETPQSSTVVIPVPVPQHQSWSPGKPYLYSFVAQLRRDRIILDEFRDRFGFRSIEVSGREILLNGKPIFLRGYGDDAIDPINVAPLPNRSFYEHLIGRAREYGFNFSRCHTWVPPRAYFEVADEKGLLVQAELATGLHPFLKPSPSLQQLWREELKRILYTRFNHPSLAFYSMSNELGDELEKPEVRGPFDELANLARQIDPTRIITVTSGMGNGAETEPLFDRGIYLVNPMETSFIKKVSDYVSSHDKPFLWHEMGYFCSYPDPGLLPSYSSGAIPWWITQAQDNARKSGLLDDLPRIVQNSQKLQQVCRKWQMELARRCPQLDGFHWWMFQDTTWAVEGIVDDFCKSKPGAPVEEVLASNGDVVVLLANEPYNVRSGTKLDIEVLVSNFSEEALRPDSLQLEIAEAGKPLSQAAVDTSDTLPVGLSSLAKVQIQVPSVKIPTEAALTARMSYASGAPHSNSWRIWIFPDPPGAWKSRSACYDPDGVLRNLVAEIPRLTTDTLAAAPRDKTLLAARMTSAVLDFARDGGKVLLLSSQNRGGPTERPAFREGDHYPMWFAPTFWGAPHTTGGGNWGTLIKDEKHVLGNFPHDGWCDMQFYSLLRNVGRMDLNQLTIPHSGEPIIRSLLDWRTTGRAAYMIRSQIGAGEVILTTLNVPEALRQNLPEAEYLLSQIMTYLTTGESIALREVASTLAVIQEP